MARLSAFARPWSAPAELVAVASTAGRALASETPGHWQTARGPVLLDRPVVIGILNLTPDSFSDGGRYATRDAALSRAEQLVADGADIIDLGGESTRPGRPDPVPVDEELRRVIPVVEDLTKRHPDLLLSVDTVKAPVAKAALDAGAAIINDVSALRVDPDIAGAVAEGQAGVILMHSRGTVSDMATSDHASYGTDVVGAILEELGEALERAAQSGIAME
ncbi:MAG: dihydropteroate synthase, partial [Gemmatimonadales bacterium]|nr:dihydropteroate synthase [Gemmatimonadales bacterium]